MTNKQKYKIAKTCNVSCTLVFFFFLMINVYETWSEYGQYTLVSFFASLFVYGTLAVIIYSAINYLLIKILFVDK